MKSVLTNGICGFHSKNLYVLLCNAYSRNTHTIALQPSLKRLESISLTDALHHYTLSCPRKGFPFLQYS